MNWTLAGDVLQVVQAVIVLGLLIMGIGIWKEKREGSGRNLAGLVKAQAQAIEQVQNLVVKKVDVGRCDERFQAIGNQVDQMVTREHCDMLHRLTGQEISRTEQLATTAANAAQTVATTAAVISQQLKGLTDTLADNTKRLGRIEAALMKANGDTE